MRTACDRIERLRHEDTLQESLEKAMALMRIFGNTPFSDYDEETLRWASAAILDNIRWEALQNFQ